MSSSRKRLASGALGLAVAVTGLALSPTSASANTTGTGLVISEVYGGGGNAGATYNQDFVELFNPTGAAISVASMSVQYRSSTGTAAPTGVVPLTGSVPAGGFYLVGLATGTVGAALPTPNVTATGVNLSGTTGTVFLANQTGALTAPATGSITGNAAIVDLVGFGTSNTFEGTVAPAPSNSTTISRTAAGADSDVNSADFTTGAGSPAAGGGGTTPPPTGGVKTIAEIQGDNTDTSPLNGAAITTTGVVTSAYSTGGLAGFNIQTGGADTTPDASDGVFVYAGTNLTAAQYPTIGDTVTIDGTVTEFFGLTEINIAGPAAITAATTPQPAVVPQTVIPGTDCALPGTACLTATAINAAREKHESELYQPAGNFTVTDAYDGSPAPSTSSAFFGEIGLAASSTIPLVAPTEVIDAQATADIATRTAYNDAHRVILDDGSSTNYTTAANTGLPFPWFTATHTVRVGAAVTFPKPVVLSYGNSSWKIEPQTQVVGDPTGKVNFQQNRPAAPSPVGGDIKLATFNVLNYFPTTANEYVASGLGTCTYFTDRAGNQVTANSCNPNGPRGAANAANLTRQQTKIVSAINKLDASVVSLEEIENSIFFNKPRDFAVSTLVDALNADAGAGTWAFAPTPAPADLPAQAEQDVIRTAFIYKPANVDLVGASKVLVGSAPFSNAREPLAQGFKAKGAPASDAFAVVVNHFKSKGSGADDGTGQGLANPDRVAQANAVMTFANQFSTTLGGTGAVFLTGDFNAYTQEDPIQALVAGGFTNLESTTTPGEKSYNFGGLAGSLDHVFANAAANALVTGVDIWNINADESVYYEYSRYNYNATDLYLPGPFRASDHNPEIVGLDLPSVVTEPATRDIQILATNDFHGRIANDPTSSAAGAAVLAGAVKQLRAADPDTVFAAAGDLIGASTFESFIAKDKPTIDALNSAGLEVSAAGNHEFDQGYNDLVNRVMAPYDATTNPYGGANWDYIAANLRKKSDNSHALAPTWTEDFGSVKVGFVGAVTEHLPELVSPAGIAELNVTNIVSEVNTSANDLKAAGADVIVLLVHEGAATTAYADAVDPASDFGKIVTGVNTNIDAIVSGHTHLSYNHSVPVPAWVTEGRPVTERPVVSAGQYGTALNKLNFTVATATGKVTAKTQTTLLLKAAPTGPANYPSDPATAQIVSNAVSQADVLGAVEVGKIGGELNRAKLANGTTENRGGESTLGNLVAEIQKWATRGTESGAAQIAFMNPGGLRADLTGTGTAAFPRSVTYKQAANVQPFANTLVNMKLTGTQIRATLEQQWQPAGAARPFLKLGMSKGFTYTYDPTAAAGSHIKEMFLNGAAIVPATVYSVTVNSFLASGGDNFTALNGGASKRDTGKSDLQAQVDYFAAFAQTTPLAVDYKQQAVGVTFPTGAPATYLPGATVAFSLSSLAYSTAADAKDAQVSVKLGDTVLGTFAVDNTVGTAITDEIGTAAVSFALPTGTTAGAKSLTVTGLTTGTVTSVPITVGATTPTTPTATSVKATVGAITYGQSATVTVAVTPAAATGSVQVRNGTTVLGTAVVSGGTAVVTLPAKSLAPGSSSLTATYSGDAVNATSSTTLTAVVAKASSTTTTKVKPGKIKVKKTKGKLVITVVATGVTPTGTVKITVPGQGKQTVSLSNGKATLKLAKFSKTGKVKLKVKYVGDGFVNGSSTTAIVKVVKK